MKGIYFATGSRKAATAQVWIKEGTGKVLINSEDAKSYLKRQDLFHWMMTPLNVVGMKRRWDIICKVKGGGLSAQASAIALGVARALANYNPELRKTLKSAGLLKRDPREKERMKYGLAKRRKSFQWTKR